MNAYVKPIISLDSDIAEGIYAASGAASGISYTEGTVRNWNPNSTNNGQKEWTVTVDTNSLSGAVTLTITFNQSDVSAVWGGSGTKGGSGSVWTLQWWDASAVPSTFTMTAEVGSNVTALQIISITV